MERAGENMPNLAPTRGDKKEQNGILKGKLQIRGQGYQ